MICNTGVHVLRQHQADFSSELNVNRLGEKDAAAVIVNTKLQQVPFIRILRWRSWFPYAVRVVPVKGLVITGDVTIVTESSTMLSLYPRVVAHTNWAWDMTIRPLHHLTYSTSREKTIKRNRFYQVLEGENKLLKSEDVNEGSCAVTQLGDRSH